MMAYYTLIDWGPLSSWAATKRMEVEAVASIHLVRGRWMWRFDSVLDWDRLDRFRRRLQIPWWKLAFCGLRYAGGGSVEMVGGGRYRRHPSDPRGLKGGGEGTFRRIRRRCLCHQAYRRGQLDWQRCNQRQHMQIWQWEGSDLTANNAVRKINCCYIVGASLIP